MKNLLLIIMCVFFNISLGQTTFDWMDSAPDGNWRQGVSGVRWFGGGCGTGCFDEPGFGILRFNNNHQLTMTNNVSGTYNIHQIIFGSSNTSNRTIGNTGANIVRFFDNSGADPKIENQSSGSHTISFNILGDGDAGDPLEINPVSGNLTFNNTIGDQGSPILILGNNGFTARFNNIISGAGAFRIQQNSKVIFNDINIYSGNTELDNGELWIETTGDAIASGSAIWLGNGTMLGNTTKIFLSRDSGGTTFSRNININQGNANRRFLGGLNSSGTNTFSGSILRSASGRPLVIEVVEAGGTVAFTGEINGSDSITKIGVGTTEFSGSAKTYTGITTVNAGTLILNRTGGGTLPAGNDITVNGGTLRVSTNQTLNNLTVSSGNLIVDAGVTLTVTGTYTGGGTLNISGTIKLDGTSQFPGASGGMTTSENNASLVQTNNVTNTGNITYKRTATNIDGFDYIFWSSPVDGQSVGSIHPDPGPIFAWNTLAPNSNGASGNTSQGAWQPASGTMDAAKGYIIRGSSNFSATNMTINSTFTGIPRNGNIGATIVRGDFQGTTYNGANGVQITNLDDNHNLIGNPYPSAIRASEFINANQTLITGTVKLWQHGAAPSNSNTNPFYGTYTNNYNNDYLTINLTGTLPAGGSQIIKAGQGFFVTMVDGSTGNGTVNFTNAMRVDGSGNPLDNAGFFRMASESTSNNEKSRIWLDLIHTQNNSSVANTMVGYLNLATNDYDSLYDAVTKLEAGNGLFSNLANKLYEIQGRATFTATDEVPLTIKINNAGNYKIGINAIDGLFLGNQDIFIKDNLLNVYHNIKLSPYAFDTVNGVFEDRFKIVYQNPLSNTTTNLETVNIFKNENVIYANAKENIKSVKIFDISGRVLAEKNNVNDTKFSYNTEAFAQGVLIIQVTTEAGKVSTKKVL